MKYPRFLLFIAVIFAANVTSNAQWTPTSGPLGGYITAIDTFGGFVWAGMGHGGIFKSSDNGTTWQRSDNGIPRDYSGNIRSFLPAQGKFFAGTESAGLYVTTDMGISWSQVAAAPWLGGVTAIARNGNNIVAGINGKITRSSDNGATWTQPVSGLPAGSYYTYRLASGGGAVLAYVKAAGQGFYRSTDNGATWASVPGPAGFTSCDVLKAIGNRIFAYQWEASFNSQIRFSDDGGLTWSSVNVPGTPMYITDITISNGNYVIATTFGLMKAPVSGGVAWAYINGTLSSPLPILGVVQKANGGVFAGSGAEGIIKADTMLSGTVTLSNNGLRGTKITVLHGDGKRILAGIPYHADLMTSTNDGQTWTADSITNYYHNTVNAITNKGNLWYAAVEAAGFQLSSDGGATWRLINNGVKAQSRDPKTVFVTSNGTVLASDSNGVYKCVNDTMWTLLSTMPDSTETVHHFAEAGGYLFAGSRFPGNPTGGGLYRSSNGGQTWQKVSQSWPGGFNDVNGIVAQGGRIIVSAYGGPYVSTNNGSTWSTLSSGLLSSYGLDLRFTDMKLIGGRVYGSLLFEEDLYELKPDSTVWRNITPLANDPHVISIWGNDTSMYVGTGNSGVWKRNNSSPSSLELVRNDLSVSLYPNPAKAPVIDGDAAVKLPLMLQVVGADGKVLKGEMVERLPHSVPAAELPPGIYFITVQSKMGGRLIKWVKTD